MFLFEHKNLREFLSVTEHVIVARNGVVEFQECRKKVGKNTRAFFSHYNSSSY